MTTKSRVAAVAGDAGVSSPKTNRLHSKDFLFQLNSSRILSALERRLQMASHKNAEQLATQRAPFNSGVEVSDPDSWIPDSFKIPETV